MSGLGINTNLLVVQIVHFLLVLYILRLLLYRPLMRLFDQRRERIRSGLEQADRVREEAAAERAQLEAQLAEERRSGQERLRQAVARGEEAARRRLEEAGAEAERMLVEARAEAEATRRRALHGLQEEVAEIALAAAAKALGEGIDEAQHRRLIGRFVDEHLGGVA
jgi:F-type H+-transporting ATPase subunit b